MLKRMLPVILGCLLVSSVHADLKKFFYHPQINYRGSVLVGLLTGVASVLGAAFAPNLSIKEKIVASLAGAGFGFAGASFMQDPDFIRQY